MKKLYWVIGFIFILAIGIACIGNLIEDSNSFYYGFTQNLASDLLAGVVVGGIIAIYLNVVNDKEEQDKRYREVVGILRKEIDSNLNVIVDNREKLDGNAWTDWDTLLPGLKDETWQAIRDGGEIKWLSNKSLPLLNKYSLVYHHITSTKKLEFEFNVNLMTLKEKGGGGSVTFLRKAILDGYDRMRFHINDIRHFNAIDN